MKQFYNTLRRVVSRAGSGETPAVQKEHAASVPPVVRPLHGGSGPALRSPERTEEVPAEYSGYRRRVRMLLARELAGEVERHAAEGQYLHQGRWLTVEEIQRAIQRRRRTHRGILLQLMLVLVLLAVLGFGFTIALTRMLLPQPALQSSFNGQLFGSSEKEARMGEGER